MLRPCIKEVSMNETKRSSAFETSSAKVETALPVSTPKLVPSHNANTNDMMNEKLQQQSNAVPISFASVVSFLPKSFYTILKSENIKMENMMQSGKDTLYRITAFFASLVTLRLFFRAKAKSPPPPSSSSSFPPPPQPQPTPQEEKRIVSRVASPVSLRSVDTCTPSLSISSNSVSSSSDMETAPPRELHVVPRLRRERATRTLLKTHVSTAEQSEMGLALIAAVKHLYRENQDFLLQSHHHHHDQDGHRDDNDDDDGRNGLAMTLSVAQELFENSVEVNAIARQIEERTSHHLSLYRGRMLVQVVDSGLAAEVLSRTSGDEVVSTLEEEEEEVREQEDGHRDDEDDDDETISNEMLARLEEIHNHNAPPPVSEVVIRRTVVDINSLLLQEAHGGGEGINHVVEFPSKDEPVQLIL